MLYERWRFLYLGIKIYNTYNNYYVQTCFHKQNYLLRLSITDLKFSVRNAVSESLSVPLSFWMTGIRCDCSNRLLLDLLLYIHVYYNNIHNKCMC